MSVYRYQSRGWLTTYAGSGAKMFRLYLSTCLLFFGVIGGCEFYLDFHDPAQVLEKLQREATSVVRYEFLWRTIYGPPLL